MANFVLIDLGAGCGDCSADRKRCISCIKGYYLNSNELCKPCNSTLDHLCVSCTADGTYCLQCQNNYVCINNTKCCSYSFGVC